MLLLSRGRLRRRRCTRALLLKSLRHCCYIDKVYIPLNTCILIKRGIRKLKRNKRTKKNRV